LLGLLVEASSNLPQSLGIFDEPDFPDSSIKFFTDSSRAARRSPLEGLFSSQD
ncbi:hypothetical protein Tco_1159671, partial [Tanacetum coccineum]